MLNLRLDVVRADDLLVLSFEFVNLDFDVDETPVLPRLVRFSRDEDAFVIVHFPPQSSDFQLLDDSNFRHMTEDDFGRLADLRFQRHERLVGEHDSSKQTAIAAEQRTATSEATGEQRRGNEHAARCASTAPLEPRDHGSERTVSVYQMRNRASWLLSSHGWRASRLRPAAPGAQPVPPPSPSACAVGGMRPERRRSLSILRRPPDVLFIR